jgi:hypothetical protein
MGSQSRSGPPFPQDNLMASARIESHRRKLVKACFAVHIGGRHWNQQEIMKRRVSIELVALLIAAAIPAWTQTAQTTASQPTKVLIPAGTVLHVRLETTLTSKTSKEGDKFRGVVERPVNVGGKEAVPEGSIVTGHVTFVKPSKRIKGRAAMRIVLDQITTPEEDKFAMSGTLEDTSGGPCTKTGTDDEGTIQGCGKTKKDAAKDAAIGGAMGAGIGATIGMGSAIDCRYFGNCGGPGMGSSTLYGAGIGAATALVYNLFKHEKQVVLVGGMHLTFVVNRSIEAEIPADTDTSTDGSK